jgi:hypothetical protein
VKVAHIRLCHSGMLYVRFGAGFLLLAWRLIRLD